MKVAFQEIEAPRAAGAYRDPRADGGKRDVTLTARGVMIDRRLHGIRMKIQVPAMAYKGVALGLEETLSGRLCFKVALRHRDHDLDVLLVETFDEAEAMAMWSGWAEHLSIGMIAEREDGSLERIGEPRKARQAFSHRRGNRATRRSRGRFVRRRRMGEARHGALTYDNDNGFACEE